MDVEFKNILRGDQGCQALKPGGPARLRAPGREPHTRATALLHLLGEKHLNGNNVKFHSYLMSSDLTGPQGKDRSKMIVLDKFLKAGKSNRQPFRNDVCGMKRENAHKTVAGARPARCQLELG